MKRRDFLKLGGLSALTMLFGQYGAAHAAAKNSATLQPMETHSIGRRVDLHAHAILPSYMSGMEELGIDPVAEEGYPVPQWSVEAHLKFMADSGIDYSVLSLPTPHIYRGDDKLSCRIARSINEEMAGICRDHPDKFGFVATLPTPDVRGSLEEIAYGIDELGALGVKVPSNSNGIYLGDPSMDEIFAELDRRVALVILHPSPAGAVPREGVVTGRVMALFEYPTDTTRAVLNLMAHGTLERFTRIRLVVPHVGSFLPYMSSRASAMFRLLATRGLMEPVSIETSLKNLYYDLAGDPMPDAMDILLKITDESHLVYGSDYPYVPAPILLKKKEALDRELANRRWMGKIYTENAATLLHEKQRLAI